MKNYLTKGLYPFALLLTIIINQACGVNDYSKIDQEFESVTWGGWLLQKADNNATPNDQYLERNYKGWVVTGLKTTEIDSVLIYRNRQPIFAEQVAERILKNENDRKIVYKLNNGKYYWIQFIPVDGPEDGTGNDQLLVSDFVNQVQDLDQASTYLYVRTNFGKRPW